jgi:CheY-like chemotaxis protein
MLGGNGHRKAETAPTTPDRLVAPGARVLVVDDNEVNRAVIVGMLESYVCTAIEAANGREAAAQVTDTYFDLVFMDCQMPVMDGFEATAEIRRREASDGRRRTPIVALTASALKGERERCLAAGMDDYLAKPFRQEALGEMVSRWVGIDPRPVHAGLPLEQAGTNGGNRPGNGRGSLDNTVLDSSVIEAIRAMPNQRSGDPLSRLAGIYLQHTPKAIYQLRVAADGGECAEVQRIAHTIRSSSGMLGAIGLAALLGKSEEAARAQETQLGPLITAVEAEYQRVERALGDLLREAANG